MNTSLSKFAAHNQSFTWTRLYLLWIALMVGAPYVFGDTVTLKDGTVLQGFITAESSTTLSIYIELSGGTITQTREVNKADIASIVRWTPEQKAEWQMNRDYEKLQRYSLNPSTSYTVDYYTQVIDGVFRKFLAQHPNSPHTAAVNARITEWKAERDLVVAGNVKFHGRWAPMAEVAGKMEHERGQQLLQQARTSISQGNFEGAIQQLQPVVRMDKQPDLASQAKSLLASTYEQAVNRLETQRQQLIADIAATQQRVDQASQALAQAETSQKQTTGQSPVGVEHIAPAYQPMGTTAQPVYQSQIAVNKARTDLSTLSTHLELAKSQLDVATKRLAALKAQAQSANNPAPAPAQPAASQPAPTPSTPGNSPDALVGLVAWAKNNWIGMLVAVMAIVFVVTRFFKD